MEEMADFNDTLQEKSMRDIMEDNMININNNTMNDNIEDSILREAKTQLMRILELLPNPYKSNLKTEERKEIKERAMLLYATVHQIFGKLTEIRQEMEKKTNKNTEPIEQRDETRKNEEVNHIQLKQPTYAEITRRNLKYTLSQTTKTINDKSEEGDNSAVLIYPGKDGDTQLNMKEVSKEIMNNIQPHQIKVKIKQIKQIRGNGLCFRVGNEQEGNRLKQAIQNIAEIKNKINCKTATGRKPRVILLNVPQSIQEDEIIEIMSEQNDIWRDMNKETIKENCKISTIITGGQRKENCCHVVITVTPQIRKILIGQRTISLSWSTIRVDDFVPVTRCYRCCGFGHWARDCQKQQVCSHCTKEHGFKECKMKHEIPTCINCIQTNRKLPPERKQATNHNAFHRHCPQLTKIKERIIQRTNYEM
ncbi:uncharacterized protein LOC111621862 [Centruroides sculpturatus]|uniref:uncharacterized protein LOC111621862 n=1 Tax=Centruroides sculpturatus TaxID=218467 RepID=UPI000C6D421D|nr:uncharacterized protein LOC111621862 [Centruroides sculpturatus]